MQDFILIVFIGFGFWYWWDTMSCKEIGRLAASQACAQADLQFLDDTVGLKKIWLSRNNHGRLHFCRLFFFEFTSDGSQRYYGRIVMVGKQIKELEMDAYRI